MTLTASRSAASMVSQVPRQDRYMRGKYLCMYLLTRTMANDREVQMPPRPDSRIPPRSLSRHSTASTHPHPLIDAFTVSPPSPSAVPPCPSPREQVDGSRRPPFVAEGRIVEEAQQVCRAASSRTDGGWAASMAEYRDDAGAETAALPGPSLDSSLRRALQAGVTEDAGVPSLPRARRPAVTLQVSRRRARHLSWPRGAKPRLAADPGTWTRGIRYMPSGPADKATAHLGVGCERVDGGPACSPPAVRIRRPVLSLFPRTNGRPRGGRKIEGSRSRLTPGRASKVSMRRAAPVSTAKTGKIRCLSLATSGSLASRRLGHRAPSPASWPTRQTQEGGSSSAERMTAYTLACKTSVYAIPDGTTAAGAP
ncbi:hypothetical protein DCS_06018 [Drechmeria coniospora]|uniref:Uncharacterized protein n=1 Tax=Drechmeria coniospora TaxID=98403 RepID=A0A151GAF5_DRECN|nr:hypothetical protein DCS_06018 [Drechmeria coniospora]KYK54062.1 hypothetical protein DCS_06018 [Drechmeria coniospora]